MATKPQADPNRCEAQECWDTVQRIAASYLFHRATRARELLLYLADRSLYGSSEEITETQIAEKVFGRKEFNPVEDNIVRATVRQLRFKLKEYFETEGKGETWIAELPRGSYHISFSRRTTEPPVTAPAAPEWPRPRRRFSSSAPLFATVSALALCSTVAAIVLGIRYHSQVVSQHSPALMDLLVANSKHTTQVVVIDSALVLLQSFAGKNVELNEYAARTYLPRLNALIGFLPENARELLDSRQITSFSDVEIAAAISREYGNVYPIRIRHARSLNVRDFQNGDHFVLIGSPLANPWVALFNDVLNFQFENRSGSWPVIRNRKPRPGEQAIYGETAGYDEAGPQYAHIAVLHNKLGAGRIALIAGTSMEGTEAAGRAFLDAGFANSLKRVFQVERLVDLPDFEVLLKTVGVGGAGYGAQIVATRKIPAQ